MAHETVTGPIVSALQAGNPEEAEQFCRAALPRHPDDRDLLVLLALCLERQGRFRDALSPLVRLTQLHPDDFAQWENYATALYHAGGGDTARRAAEQAATRAPNELMTLERLGQWAMQLGAPRAASIAFGRAVALAPDSVPVKIEAVRARVACHDILAGEALRPWRTWLPLADDLLFELADLLAEVGELPDALEILEKLAAGDPVNWPVQLLLAKVYERINQPALAESRLDWIAAMQVGTPDAEWINRELKVQRSQLAMRATEYSIALQLLEEAGPKGSNDSGYHFSLAKVHDRLGNPAAAMDALREAHRLQVEDLCTSKSYLLEPGAPLLPGVNDRVTAAEYRAWPELRAPDTNQSPVFVVGFPRSGTTLLEQMLDAHPRLQSMDERPFLNILAGQLHEAEVRVPGDLHKLNQRDIDELRKRYVLMGCEKVSRRWDARLVDKNPLNMLWLPMLHRLFPSAKIILAVRHPCDVIWSCYLQDFRASALQAACRSLDQLARAYVAAMSCWLHHVEVFHPDVFVSRFEDLVTAPHRQTRRIAEFLDLGDAEPMMCYAARAREKGYIKTPSYTQVVEPVNTRGIGRWRHYQEFFAPVLPIVQPMMEHWGYAMESDVATE